MNAKLVLEGKNRWAIDNMDCREWMNKIPFKSVDLLFADPPFNIDYGYDEYRDKRKDYDSWTAAWIEIGLRTLKPHGACVVAINDENAAIVATELSRRLVMRNWLIWYYSFGTHQKKKFGRSKTHLLYFVKDPRNFTFNTDAVRVPSKRLTKYKDKRANPLGRVPGDVWNFSRLCGTFKERTGHPCQMPEALLDRIILALSNPGDIVCDPFGGSFTTSASAVRLGRRAISCDTSKAYCKAGEKRLKAISGAEIRS